MRITCPHCGERDLREFTCLGGAEALARPADGAPDARWHAYLHLRENPAGPSPELWQHTGGCRAWLLVRRDTLSHAVLEVRPAHEQGGGGDAD